MTHCKTLSSLIVVVMTCAACVGGPSGGSNETATAGSSGNAGIAGNYGSTYGGKDGSGGSSGVGHVGTGGASGAAGASGSSAGTGGSAGDLCFGVTVGTSCSQWGACAHCGSLYCQSGTWTPESISTCGSSGASGSAGSSGAAGSNVGTAGSNAGFAGSLAGVSGTSGSAGVASSSGSSGSVGSMAGAAGSLTGGSGGMSGSLCPKQCGFGQVCIDQSGIALCVDAGSGGSGGGAGTSGVAGSSGAGPLRLYTFRHTMPPGMLADISIYDRAMDAQGNILWRPQPIGWGLTEGELKYIWGFAADSYPSPCSKTGVNQISCPVHFPAGAIVQLSANMMMLQGQNPTWSCPLTVFTGVTDVLDENNLPVILTVTNPVDDVAGGGYCVFQFVVP
ncbi:hypothetical protein IT408_01190 [Candidatus Uhrbacteria bacterium]|nr:hypothetical protein [Candidatus Uhrbacteria bacterium]